MNSELFFSFHDIAAHLHGLDSALATLGWRFHIMDQPGERKVHQHPVPRIGGIAFALEQ